MRKLRLQVQMSIDGFVSGPNGEMDWMEWNWDDQIKNYVTEITNTVDSIILGRKLAQGFIPHWTSALNDPKTADDFARKMVETRKIVFSKTLTKSEWDNTELATGELAKHIIDLKSEQGRDIIAYGGATFVSNLIKENLIDEYHLFVNPTIIGMGKSIFHSLDFMKGLALVKSISFECGIVLLYYKPK